MPSCSAYDLPQVFNTPLGAPAEPTGSGGGPPPARADCWKEQCANTKDGRGAPCPPGLCQHGGHWHARPPCPDHDRPWGLEPSVEAQLSPEAVKRQRTVDTKLVPTVHAFVECLRDLATAGELTDEERAQVEGLRAWLEKLRAEQVTPGK